MNRHLDLFRAVVVPRSLPHLVAVWVASLVAATGGVVLGWPVVTVGDQTYTDIVVGNLTWEGFSKSAADRVNAAFLALVH